eukprot:5653159-Amphidinium_carterae.1
MERCEETTRSILDDNVKMTVLLNRLKGLVQSHLLLHIDMTKPDFDKAAKVDIGCRGLLQEC